MNDKGCAFEIQGGGISRYFYQPFGTWFLGFYPFLGENRGEACHAPLPLHKRIPQAVQISEAEWRNIADNQDPGYSCFIVVNITENQVWVNEDTGGGMALYCFPVPCSDRGCRLRCYRSVGNAAGEVSLSQNERLIFQKKKARKRAFFRW